MPKETKEVSETIVINNGNEEVFEFLGNVIQEAQAAGSIVQIITIYPSVDNLDDSGDVIKGCKPKADHCPKGAY